MLALGVAAERHDRIVFDHDPGVALLAGRDARMQLALQLPHFAIGFTSEIEQAYRFQGRLN
jgi:hypothetical protein